MCVKQRIFDFDETPTVYLATAGLETTTNSSATETFRGPLREIFPSTVKLTPQNPIICLFCGELLCLDDCCQTQQHVQGSDRLLHTSEMESHAESCSTSSGLFISLTSSMILVSRGRQAAIWGTVYLDAHMEEDRNLKRGKPLFLCETRLRWLEYDWADQEWQRVYQWFNMFHSNVFINYIRDCHLHH
ncbi:Protein CBG04287 [Caenorhabditis briggsae]|uniref:E3 ubiquitin-protein ligase n=1 Tax=Caenorhabditis briggsae TaxID=6238 RepID=A8WX57_CAEBR|nr:Protein CBG04287 [Caenorhabditis briggsae]CAP25028.2 Protein CBG04287 [Caenorhabditis briggsae]